MGSVRATVASRLALALAIGALILAPGMAKAQLQVTLDQTANYEGDPPLGNPLFEQFESCIGTGTISQQVPDAPFNGSILQAADDFELTSTAEDEEDSTFFIQQVIALGLLTGGSYDGIAVEIYADDGPGGLPGTLLCSEVGLTNTGGMTDPMINVSLDGSCELAAGTTYWVSVYPELEFAGTNFWLWISTNVPFGSEYAWRDQDLALGPGNCEEWQLGNTICGNGIDFPDLCFGIGGEEEIDTGGGVPAMGTTGAIVMLLVMMAISVFYLRRRQTA